MVTLDDVKEGVISKLSSFKEPDTPIYSEELEQGFKEPCFFVRLLQTTQEQQLANRYRRDHLIEIRYFPVQESNLNEQLLVIAESLYDGLEYITINNGLIRGGGMIHEVIDNVLHFSVRYTMNVRRDEPEHEYMGYLYKKEVLKSE